MSITSQRHSPPLRSGSPDLPIGGVNSAPRRRGRPRPIKPRPSGTPAVVGPPNHAPGVPVMGAPSQAPHVELMGRPDTGPRLYPMGGPGDGPRVDLIGESDLAFVDSLFTWAEMGRAGRLAISRDRSRRRSLARTRPGVTETGGAQR
jgi:hypothetical protein